MLLRAKRDLREAVSRSPSLRFFFFFLFSLSSYPGIGWLTALARISLSACCFSFVIGVHSRVVAWFLDIPGYFI